jgi:Rab GDP dissociation inhibitor
MSEEEKGPEPVTINGKTYAPLADGKYHCVIMGTGLKECMLSGLLSVAGYKILHVDRNNYYGGESASLNLENLFKHFRGIVSTLGESVLSLTLIVTGVLTILYYYTQVPDDKTLARFGKNRDYNVDLVPKFIMACGQLVKILIHTKM